MTLNKSLEFRIKM